ncbi:hypothetical protein NITGR_1060042 [Nitrospina gracilis 3/211]|uniref:L,D-TPase catalytic domain-containing protein n=2 Tax=Nitrospina TaxID=35800 RepID=M1YVL0_NITG3|nr:L,D-transpeptidase [Nitrospina sp. Nb-3]MCF8722308.1 hypothetical protein [Nitrospina sp. Nb-3]CCQ89515.1 hypothetical protein NITGR_1060042 [Nitrospina gracilis 3/211]
MTDITGLDYLLFQYDKTSPVGRGVVIWFDDDDNPLDVFAATTGTASGLKPTPEGLFWGDYLRPRTKSGMVCPLAAFSLDLNNSFRVDAHIDAMTGETSENNMTLQNFPLNHTTRDLLRIHPDQVTGRFSEIGKQGCIGVVCADAKRFFNKLNGYLGIRKNIKKQGIAVLVEAN